MENLALRRVLRTASTTHLIDVKVNGKTHTVLAREIQQHATRGDLIHIDFMEVDMKSTITASAELVLVGKSAPAIEGLGSDVLPLHSIDIECLPGDLISELEVDASLIATPDTIIYVSDLVAPKGVTILTDPETVVARFEYEAAEEAEEEYETSVEGVEIIGAADEEDEE
jgi:large subunit ribosomal protein L25